MSPAHTPEAAWAGWPFLETLPALDLPTGRVLVVSAHPDDEVLGAGGLLATRAGTEAWRPHFVTVTDGEASHGRKPPWLDHDLGERRAQELVESLRTLGYPSPEITRLRLPDASVADHIDELARRLTPLVSAADLVLCPASNDGHIDHATVGQMTAQVCAGVVPVWEFPIWLWHWTRPGDSAVSWEGAGRLVIPPHAVQRKRRAIECFGSQISPLPGDGSHVVILPADVLEHFQRPYEVFFT